MIESVLIANRGEIAVRIAGTLRRLGIRAYGVYTPVDRGAPHTRVVDRAVPLGSAAEAGTLTPYLDIEAMVAAAKAVGADAVHPGYGFLAESHAAAAAVREAGLTWIGPSPEAIASLGDKIEAKRIAEAAGVPVVPGISETRKADGTAGATLTPRRVAAFAERHGYPVMIKAAAGGGGKGMRRIEAGDEIEAGLEAARREAEAAFGSGDLLVERLIEPARHIEVQVMRDAHGVSVAFGERECSLQRRHQKLIEETPSIALDETQRQVLCEHARALADQADYLNAGTVEFLVDAVRPDRHYFLEMNTRLQVEHPVTEAVYGIDLVELQIAVARGESLVDLVGAEPGSAGRGGGPEPAGHAIEARICAERPADGFLPATGRITAYSEPAGARVDSGVEVGMEVTSDFDPMLAKVIVHAPTRRLATARLHEALADTVILGVETNRDFLRWLLKRQDFSRGKTLVSTVGDLLDSGRYAKELTRARRQALPHAALALALTDSDPSSHGPVGEGFERADAWRVQGRGWAHWSVEGGGGEQVDLAARPVAGAEPAFELKVGGGEPEIVTVVAASPAGTLQISGEPGEIRYSLTDQGVWLDGPYGQVVFPRVNGGTAASDLVAGSLEASLPGVVLAVEVEPGDEVEAGQILLRLESMKMEIEVTAPITAEVETILVGPGEHVQRGQLLATLSETDAEPGGGR